VSAELPDGDGTGPAEEIRVIVQRYAASMPAGDRERLIADLRARFAPRKRRRKLRTRPDARATSAPKRHGG
jgi:hypothetical protein